ncbi:hypothetical protein, partial [Pseudomonas aeruginosa]|uniref:hypothetical protein n=1 Tax=Pseudomonas aeruginosa TaxID=287 RepID=UPI00197BDD0A
AGGSGARSCGGQTGAKGGVEVAHPAASEDTARDSSRRSTRCRSVGGRYMGDSLLELVSGVGQLLLYLQQLLLGLG